MRTQFTFKKEPTVLQQINRHAEMQRLQDQLFAAIKRAEAEYFEGVKRITDEIKNS